MGCLLPLAHACGEGSTGTPIDGQATSWRCHSHQTSGANANGQAVHGCSRNSVTQTTTAGPYLCLAPSPLHLARRQSASAASAVQMHGPPGEAIS